MNYRKFKKINSKNYKKQLINRNSFQSKQRYY